jgi:hypothetical protein
MSDMNGTYYFINYIKPTILSSYALINRIAVNMKKINRKFNFFFLNFLRRYSAHLGHDQKHPQYGAGYVIYQKLKSEL